MRAVDTNVLVRLSIGDDPLQVAAAEEFVEAGAWASTLAVAEAIWVLAKVYQFSAKDQCTAIEMMLNNPILALQDPEAVAGALELFRGKPALGFSDCLIIELARHAGHLPLGTFDRKLARVDGAQQL